MIDKIVSIRVHQPHKNFQNKDLLPKNVELIIALYDPKNNYLFLK